MPTTPMDYIWPGIIAAQAIYAATKLRIPDLLAPGPKSAAELASDCAAHPPTLERLLRALASIEMFALEPDGRFCNTPLTEVLRADHPKSQRESVLFAPASRHFPGSSDSTSFNISPHIPTMQKSSIQS